MSDTKKSTNTIAIAIVAVGILFCGTVAYIAHGTFSRLDKIEKLAQQIPELTEKVNVFADGVEARVQNAREALPAAADELGGAGARAYQVFQKLKGGDELPAEAE